MTARAFQIHCSRSANFDATENSLLIGTKLAQQPGATKTKLARLNKKWRKGKSQTF